MTTRDMKIVPNTDSFLADWQTLVCNTAASCQTSGTVSGCRDEPYTGCIDASSPSSLTSLCGNDESYDGNICWYVGLNLPAAP